MGRSKATPCKNVKSFSLREETMISNDSNVLEVRTDKYVGRIIFKEIIHYSLIHNSCFNTPSPLCILDSLIEAAGFVKTVENRQGIQISAIEEIAYKNGWIDKDKLHKSAERYGKSTYGQHLKKVSERKIKY